MAARFFLGAVLQRHHLDASAETPVLDWTPVQKCQRRNASAITSPRTFLEPMNGYLRPSLQKYRYLVDFLYIIKEINDNPTRLPNVTLGYHVHDSCGDTQRAVMSLLKILSGTGEPVPNYSCMGQRNIAGFIGDLESQPTVSMAHILGVLGYSQISYGASDPSLRDRVTFPYFFRTVQSDEEEYIVLVKLLKYFGWNWVGIIQLGGPSGLRDHQLLIKYLSRDGICAEFSIKLSNNPKEDAQRRNIIQKSFTSVVIICGDASTADGLRNIVSSKIKKTCIFLSKWSYHLDTFDFIKNLFSGSLTFLWNKFNYSTDPKLRDFYNNFIPSKYPEDKLLEDIWMWHFSCLSRDEKRNVFHESFYFHFLHNCSGQEKLTDIPNYPSLYHSASLIHAVEIMSIALQNMWNFLGYQTNENIRKNGAPASTFNDKGEFPHQYEIINPQLGDTWTWNIVGNYVPWALLHQRLTLMPDKIIWKTSNNKLPQLSFSLSLNLFIVFIIHMDTPIVRANNKSLSFLLLVSIKLSFLSVFLFLGRPVDITCMLRNITFGITFSIAVSSLLSKTIMVCVAFKATKPGSSWRTWVGVKLSNTVVLFCSSIQIIICMTWLFISPPFQELDLHTYPGTIIIQCNEGSAIGFYSVIGYMGLLAAVSFVLAFLARTLPDSFNEAKYITFSMLLFCSVWITMIPAYLSTKGKNTVCVEIFAILTSSAGLLASIFLPKCYMIVFRPEINTKSQLLGNKY
ncbi:hypothetical protein XELAEV_18004324mg [Xenopus laevis]|uniref:G-protein coupled receptors family 3 profile domain-containing protein n=1 Tax=Xenopus laevis TaxID=8355 RepID=A0A974GZS8_XENLA|nr:hypothetical protein XELAEV_18004324mg [Xenopus laevis]